MVNRFFTEEVTHLLGRRVRSRSPTSVVPKVSNRYVVATKAVEQGSFNLVVEWELAQPGMLERTFFSGGEFDRSLIEA